MASTDRPSHSPVSVTSAIASCRAAVSLKRTWRRATWERTGSSSIRSRVA